MKYKESLRDKMALRFAVDIRKEMGGGGFRSSERWSLRKAIAREAYAMADAMLEIRKNK